MKQYEMTLIAISEKKVGISAKSAVNAAEMLEEIYNKTNILDFTDKDVTDVSIVGKAVDRKVAATHNRRNVGDVRILVQWMGNVGGTVHKTAVWSA